MPALQEIKAEVDRLAAKIGASGYDLPTYGHSEDFARPHIESDSRGYHFVVVERGEELKRFTTPKLAELFERVFKSITFNLACKYELEHRVELPDCRKIIWLHQIDLLAMLSADWAEREAKRHKEILSQHPFDDFGSVRATLCKDYRDQGQIPDAAWRLACEKYSLPVT